MIAPCLPRLPLQRMLDVVELLQHSGGDFMSCAVLLLKLMPNVLLPPCPALPPQRTPNIVELLQHLHLSLSILHSLPCPAHAQRCVAAAAPATPLFKPVALLSHGAHVN